jgi:hypothetical protein
MIKHVNGRAVRHRCILAAKRRKLHTGQGKRQRVGITG